MLFCHVEMTWMLHYRCHALISIFFMVLEAQWQGPLRFSGRSIFDFLKTTNSITANLENCAALSVFYCKEQSFKGSLAAQS